MLFDKNVVNVVAPQSALIRENRASFGVSCSGWDLRSGRGSEIIGVTRVTCVSDEDILLILIDINTVTRDYVQRVVWCYKSVLV